MEKKPPYTDNKYICSIEKKKAINKPAGPNKRYGSGKFDFLTMFMTAICCSSFNFDAYTPLEFNESLGYLNKYSTNKIPTIVKIKRIKITETKTRCDLSNGVVLYYIPNYSRGDHKGYVSWTILRRCVEVGMAYDSREKQCHTIRDGSSLKCMWNYRSKTSRKCILCCSFLFDPI